jgi:tetratricopeptide (TPR) repeat protein
LIVIAASAAATTAFAQGTPPAPAAPAPATTAPVAPPVRFDWQGNHKRAQAALAARDYKNAIQLFTDIINSGRLPKNWVAPTFYMRGKAYRGARQFDKAVADYQSAIQTDPKLDIAHYELGATYQALDQHAKAISAFDQAITLRENNAGYYYARCVSLSWVSRYGDAANDCRRATRLKPGDAAMLATLGRLYEDMGQKAQAIETYKAALAINPNQAEAKEGLAFLTKKGG